MVRDIRVGFQLKIDKVVGLISVHDPNSMEIKYFKVIPTSRDMPGQSIENQRTIHYKYVSVKGDHEVYESNDDGICYIYNTSLEALIKLEADENYMDDIDMSKKEYVYIICDDLDLLGEFMNLRQNCDRMIRLLGFI